MDERYSIYCKECEDEVFLIYNSDAGSFRCPHCDSIYYDEDGVWDNEEIKDYYLQFRGARLAGLIPDEFDIDKGIW